MHKAEWVILCALAAGIVALTGIFMSLPPEKVDKHTVEGNVTKIERGYVYIHTKDGTVSLPLADVQVPVDEGYYIKIETRRK